MPLHEPGSSTTYDKVRDWAIDAAGFDSGCPVRPEVLDHLMLNCLQQVYTKVWDWPHYQHKWTVTIPANQVAPGDPNISLFTTDQVFDPMFKVINKFERSRDGVEIWEGKIIPATAEPETDPTQEWKVWGDEFVVSPPSDVEETFRVFGYRELKRSIFVVDQFDEVIWQEVDLPDEAIEIFQKCLQGFILAAASDTQGASYWLTVAAAELEQLVATEQITTDRTKSNEGSGLFVMGGAKAKVSTYAPFTIPSSAQSSPTAVSDPGQIKNLYEANSNTNAFTDDYESKLNGINSGRGVALGLFATNAPCATGVSGIGIPIGADLASYRVAGVTATVFNAGQGGIMEIDVIRRREGVSDVVVSTSIDDAEYNSSTAAGGDSIESGFTDLERGDMLTVSVNSVHTAPAEGLSVYIALDLV